MATSVKIGQCNPKLNILRLPEEIFREIFDYLEIHALYFILRKVCTTITHYVDNYMKLSKTVILENAAAWEPGVQVATVTTTSHLYYFSTIRNNVKSIHANKITSIPFDEMNLSEMKWSETMRKGAMMKNGKLVFVLDSSQIVSQTVDKENVNIVAYNPKENKWTKFRSRDVYTNQVGVCLRDWCTIGNSKLLLCNHGIRPWEPELGTIQIVSLNHPSDQNDGTQNTFTSDFLNLPTLLKSLQYYTLTKVSNNKVIIIGGKEFEFHNSRDSTDVYNNFLWQGTLTNMKPISFGRR